MDMIDVMTKPPHCQYFFNVMESILSMKIIQGWFPLPPQMPFLKLLLLSPSNLNLISRPWTHTTYAIVSFAMALVIGEYLIHCQSAHLVLSYMIL